MYRFLLLFLVALLLAGCAPKRRNYVENPPQQLQDFCGWMESRGHEVRYARSTGWDYTEANNKYLYDQYLKAVLPHTPNHLTEHVKAIARGEVEAPFDEMRQNLLRRRDNANMRGYMKSSYYLRCYAMFGPLFYEDPKSPLYTEAKK